MEVTKYHQNKLYSLVYKISLRSSFLIKNVILYSLIITRYIYIDSRLKSGSLVILIENMPFQ